MTDLLSIGASGINVYQRALSTVSNNIANLSTEGYSRQTTDIAQNKPKDLGKGYIGTGAFFDGVSRQYDSFLESSLQQATSDLESQSSALRFTDKILDLVGDEDVGMASAFDQFFASAKNLSADPASTTLRGIYLRDAEAVTTRFQGLSEQIGNVGVEVREAIEADVRSVNSIVEQLAQVNRQLLKKKSVDLQSPELLDRRDQLLRELSEYVEVTTAFDSQGRVDVSLTESISRGVILKGNDASQLAIAERENNPSALTYQLSGPQKSETIGGIGSGSLGGYTKFYERTLNAVNTELDRLVFVFSDAVNEIQETGLNALGELGEALFRIEPSFQLDRRASIGDYEVQTSVIEPSQFVSNAILVNFDDVSGTWTAIDQVTGQTAVQNAAGAIQINGNSILITGLASPGDSFQLVPSTRAASGIRVALTDPREVATSSLFRATPSNQNVSDALPTVSVIREAQRSPTLQHAIESNPERSRSILVNGSIARPFANIPAGTEDVRLFIEPDASQPLALQIFTLEGKHLLGEALDDQTAASMLTQANGFSGEIEYDAAHLNGDGLTSYRDVSVFYGARSTPVERIFQTVSINPETGSRMSESARVIDRAQLTSSGISAVSAPIDETLKVIESGALRLNGQTMPALTVPPGEALTASKIAGWFNASASAQGLNVIATAKSELVVPIDSLDFAQPGFFINGIAINPNTSDSAPLMLTDLEHLVEQVNLRSSETNVIAYVSKDGDLVMTNRSGFEGDTFTLTAASGANRTAVMNQATRKVVGEYTLVATDDETEIRLELTERGSPTDLAGLGLRTEVAIDGLVDEQLIVMATGVDQIAGEGRISATYSEAKNFNALQSLRQSPLDIKFVSETMVTVTDRLTGTLLARRPLEVDGTFTYRDLVLEFNEPPALGDEFVIDGNNTGPNQTFDAQGNNANILRIVDLESSRDISTDGRTLTERYLDFVNVVGNESVQAQIARDALTVVKDQAVAARDAVSGVNLDREAADLIRFQQAYQASAQVMQVASRLFDSILQVR